MMDWIKKNDIVSKALSVGCAILLWFYVVSSTDLDMTKTFSNFSVDFIGMDLLTSNNLMVTSGSDSTVTFKITGKADKIADIDADKITVTADLSSISSPGDYNIKYQVYTTSGDVTVSKTTAAIKISVDRKVSKLIPVDLKINGTLPDGFESDDYSLSPDAITVTGPEKLLDTIVSAVAVYDISDIKTSTDTTLSYTLVDSNGAEVKSSYISVDSPSVKLSFGVRQVEDIPIVLNVTDFGFITGDLANVTLEPSSITIKGSPDVVSTLNQIELGTIDLEDVFEKEVFVFELALRLPNGVTCEDEITSVKVTVDPAALTKTTIELTRDMLPESSVFDYASDLAVTVWTTNEHADLLGPNSIDISLSFNEDALAPGLNEIPVTITTLDDDIVVVGEYAVVVEVH